MPRRQIASVRRLLVLLLLAAGALGAPRARAAGATSGDFLLETFGGRPRAMGQAYASIADDVYGMDYNTAGLSQIERAQVAAQYGPGPTMGSNYGFLGFALPVTANQALGLSYSIFDAGNLDVFNANGGQTGSVSAERDTVLHFAYSYAFRNLPSPIDGELHAGVGAKYVTSQLAQQLNGTTLAADAGLLYTRPLTPRSRGSLGLSIGELGSGIGYEGGGASGGSDPLPRTIRLAASYQAFLPTRDRVTVSAELDEIAGISAVSPSVGAELLYHGLIALRAGYHRQADVGALTFGTGVTWKDIGVDYAIELLSNDNQQKISVSYAFNVPWVRLPGSGQMTASPIDLLVRNIEKDMAEGHYFYAFEKVRRLIDLFPKEKIGLDYREKINGWVVATMATPEDPRFAYAVGHWAYYQGKWESAVDQLARAHSLDEHNPEIAEFLAEAAKHVDSAKEDSKLRAAARIAYLYDLASTANAAGDSEKALKILREILRISSYGPARKLSAEIRADLKKKQKTKAPESAAPPAPKPAREVEKAKEFYFDALGHYSKGEVEEAVKLLKAAYDLDPQNPDILPTLKRAEQDLPGARPEGAP